MQGGRVGGRGRDLSFHHFARSLQSLAEDVVRVRMLFANCKAEGVHISKRYLSGVELWNLIREDENLVRVAPSGMQAFEPHPPGPFPLLVPPPLPQVIVLVDARELANASHHDSFMGHFVLVTGLDEGRKGFFYKVRPFSLLGLINSTIQISFTSGACRIPASQSRALSSHAPRSKEHAQLRGLTMTCFLFQCIKMARQCLILAIFPRYVV